MIFKGSCGGCFIGPAAPVYMSFTMIQFTTRTPNEIYIHICFINNPHESEQERFQHLVVTSLNSPLNLL